MSRDRSRSIILTVVAASDLPRSRKLITLKYYIAIRGGIEEHKTQSMRSTDLKWGESFDLSVTDASAVFTSIFDIGLRSKATLYGESIVPVREFVLSGQTRTEYRLNIREPGSTKAKPGLLAITLETKFGASANAIAHNETAHASSSANISSSVTTSSRIESANQDPSVLAVIVQNADKSVALLHTPLFVSNTADIVDHGATASSSDSFNTALSIMGNLIKFGDVLSECHPFVKLAWSILTAAQKAFQAQRNRDGKVAQLLSTITHLLEVVNAVGSIPKNSVLDRSVTTIMKQIYECGIFLNDYASNGFGKRLLRDTLKSSTDDGIQQFTDSFADLRQRFAEGSNIIMSNHIRNLESGIVELQELERTKFLDGLPAADLVGVQYDAAHVCLPGTRQQLLDDIFTWVHDPSGGRLYWLSGAAGTGKSSVANSISDTFYRLGRLGASFRFNRDKDRLNSPDYLFGNIAYQLAYFDKKLKIEVLSVLQRHGNIQAIPLQNQAQYLIVDTTNGVHLAGPVIIVIDALDESGNIDARAPLLRALCAMVKALPLYIKLIITSRDERDIRNTLADIGDGRSINDATGTSDDILAFIRTEMSSLRKTQRRLGQDWPGPIIERKLTELASGLFIWASVACKFISEDDAEVQLSTLLEDAGTLSTSLDKLDQLYLHVLRQAFGSKNAGSLEAVRYVVGSIITVKDPLSQDGIDTLLGLGRHLLKCPLSLPNDVSIKLASSEMIVSSLRSLLRVDKGPIRILHPSVFDFFTNPQRCSDPRFQINKAMYNQVLALRCLAIMNEQLKMDLCDLGDYTTLNSDISDLHDRLTLCIPESLRYACRFFAQHIFDTSSPDRMITDELNLFITSHLLHWIEAMSLLGEISRAGESLAKLSDCLMSQTRSIGTKVYIILQDAAKFLKKFGQIVRRSALSTYNSALPLTPSDALLYQNFHHTIPQAPLITSSQPSWNSALLQIISGHRDKIRSVAFSPDGKKLALGSNNQAVQLWDVETGKAVGAPLVGHASYINSVAFSPDGKKLASASNDHTVRLWDVEMSEAVGAPLVGHTNRVFSVAFSPDGEKLASGSEDQTVRLWDVETGKAVGAPLVGHTSYLLSIAFSPDGKKLVSGSFDQTVRLWDVETGEAAGAPLVGHTNRIFSVAFSPDGKKLASGSEDQTVRLWDVDTGKAAGAPLVGHTNCIFSVAFSPDGKILASSSSDRTMQLWDAERGKAAGAPLTGHADRIVSVAFSPDGKKLASGSEDRTVRLWDVEIAEAGRASHDHMYLITSVAFSPDGRKLVSESGWRGIEQVWDVQTLTVEYDEDADTQITNILSTHDSALLSFDDAGFLCNAGKRLVWLPAINRGFAFDTYGNAIAVGSLSGSVTIIQFSTWLVW